MSTIETDEPDSESSNVSEEPDLAVLLSGRETFLRFLHRRINDPELAEDILQSSLLKAFQAAPNLRSNERLLPWFYTILRHAVVDSYRRRDAASTINIDSIDWPDDGEERKRACECFAALLPNLRPEYAELIRAIDLDRESGDAVARRLDITVNNLKVRHYRARQALRHQLERTCRVCAEHHCLDCTCQV